MIEVTVVNPTPCSGYRFPRELISDPVWLYFRFPLSLRMVEEMPAQSATLHQVGVRGLCNFLVALHRRWAIHWLRR